MSTVRYFSYGSNMSTLRLVARVPSATFLCVAQLQGHCLKFHKIGKDGSAKCDAFHTANPADGVMGVVYELEDAEKNFLDQIEGLGYGYGEKSVKLIAGDGETVEARTYYAVRTDTSLKPFHWYKEHVLRGAREYKLPLRYVTMIEAVKSVSDPHATRQEEELSIYL